MATNSKEARARAEARFEKQQKAAREGEKGWALYEAEGRAVREKTARLKALRLAKEAEDKEREANAPLEVKKKPAARKKVAATAK